MFVRIPNNVTTIHKGGNVLPSQMGVDATFANFHNIQYIQRCTYDCYVLLPGRSYVDANSAPLINVYERAEPGDNQFGGLKLVPVEYTVIVFANEAADLHIGLPFEEVVQLLT